MDIIQRVQQLMEEKGVTAARLTRELGLAQGAFTHWKKGHQKPSVDNVVKLAAYFDVTTDYLLLGKTPVNPAEDLSPESQKMMKEYLRLLRLNDEENAALLAPIRTRSASGAS